jgi:hypothetical protein
MSIFKPFTTSDVVVSPFKVNKLFSFSDTAALTGSGIDIFEGKNLEPTLWVSGSNPTGYISTQDKYLVYRSIRELYYYNYIYGDDGSPATTASFNVDGTITTTTQYTPNAYNYLPNTLPANRYFPTGSNNIVGVIAIPSNLFGEYIKPGTFTLIYESGSLTDDGEGGLLRNLEKVGDIIYEHGMIIITNDGTPAGNGYGFVTYGSALYNTNDSTFIQDIITSQALSCEFESTVTIYETQYKCTVRENEYNFSQNPTLISGSSNSGVIYNFATGSFFTPYATTIGLYDNNYNLLAVAKLAQPLPLSAVTDTSILVNLDL